MNTDFQDIKSYKKPNICENLYPNLTLALFAPLPAQPAQPAQPVQLNVYPACPVGRNYRTGVKSFLHLFLWGELLGTARLFNRDEILFVFISSGR